MSVVNQMLRDLEQNQSNITLDIEAVAESKRTSILVNFRFWIAILLVVVALLTWQIIQFAEVIEQQKNDGDKIADAVKSDQTVVVDSTTAGANQSASSEEPDSAMTKLSGHDQKRSVQTDDVAAFAQSPDKTADNSVAANTANVEKTQPSAAMSASSSDRAESADGGIKQATQSVDVQTKVSSKATATRTAANRAGVKVKSTRQTQIEAMSEIERLIQLGLYANAQRKLTTLLADYPDLHSAREQLAILYLQNNDSVNYLELLEQGVIDYPAVSSYRILLAKYYGQNQQWTKVLELTKNMSNNDQDIIVLQAIANQQLGNHRQAIEYYGELLNIDESRGDWWLGISISLEQLADNARALQALKQAQVDRRLTSVQQNYIVAKIKQLQDAL